MAEQSVKGALTEDERDRLLHWLHGGRAGGIQSLWAMVERILAARSQPPAERAEGEVVAVVLGDLLRYYAERRSMANPKGWDHVARKFEEAAHDHYGLSDEQAAEVRAVLAALSTGTAARDEAVVRVGFRYQDGEVLSPEREAVSRDEELPVVVLDLGDGEWLTLDALHTAALSEQPTPEDGEDHGSLR